MWLRGLAVGVLWTTVTTAQTVAGAIATDAGPDWTPERGHGSLTVWRVVAVGPPRPVSVASLSPEVRTQTAGSFGQTAGSFGQSAGDTGQTSGSFGQSSGSTGTSAGSVGQTAGSFGVSTGSLARAAAEANGSKATAPKKDSASSRLNRDFDDGHSGVADLATAVEEVGVDELQTRLDAVAGTPDAPDVLVGTPLPQIWSNQNSGLVRKYGLVTLGVVSLIPQTESGEEHAPATLQASILVRAPHPRSAREFIKWLSDRDAYEMRGPISVDAPSLLAKTALGSVLFGGDIGGADKQMAAFNPRITQQMAMGVYGENLLNGLKIDVDKSFVRANDRFAVVELRAVMESRAAFGVAHAVVVLRVDETGQWRVLQLTPNLVVQQQQVAMKTLSGFTATIRREQVVQVASASLAAPVDGDDRSPGPELWWDNVSNGTLEIVEWQRSSGRSWTSSNMYFVPEDTGHLRTRTTARFASSPGTYRWRVWSLGTGGTVAISSWRSVNILPQ